LILDIHYDDTDDMNKIKNNTVIGMDGDQEEMLRQMLGRVKKGVPGETPMNTQMDEDKD
jgi:hypothetical protein